MMYHNDSYICLILINMVMEDIISGRMLEIKCPGASEVSRSNPDAKWETAVKQNYGVDATFLAERLIGFL